jgi:hypothetical protein
MDADSAPEINTLLLFTNPRASIKAPEAPFTTLESEKVKDFLRKKAKDNSFSMEKVDKVNSILLPAKEKEQTEQTEG